MYDDKLNKTNHYHSYASDGKCGGKSQCGLFLQSLSPTQGMLLAVYVANLMSEGLNADQQNILGNFVASVGELILYRAAFVEEDDGGSAGSDG